MNIDKNGIQRGRFNSRSYLILTVLVVLLFSIITCVVVYARGGKKLSENVAGEEFSLDVEVISEGSEYKLNEDVVTVLVMGIDKETYDEDGNKNEVVLEGSQYYGGQADGLFLAVIDPKNEVISFVAIDRNAMTDIDIFDEDGNYKGVRKLQVCLQHGFGYGLEESCVRQVKTVSRMFHGIKINSYVAINMDAIPALADAVGGVPVVVVEDVIVPIEDVYLYEGENVNLTGKTALRYVRSRQSDEYNSNARRLEREKQFVNSFISKVRTSSIGDISMIINLYSVLQDYMVTDIDASTLVYMLAKYLNYSFDMENMYALKGETVIGAGGFEEFYPDEEYMNELILKLFYEKVN